MTPNEELLIELKKINQRLDLIANPFRHAWFSFRAGIFQSLGNLFGTVIIATLVVYLFSQLQLGQAFTQWFQSLIESTVTQLTPQFVPSNPFGI